MFLNGFIFLDRKFLTWRWYNDKNVKELFIHLLLTANFEDSEFEDMTIKRGQLKTKICDLVYQLKQTDSQIRNNLMKLKNTGEITIKTTNKNTIISIEKYDIYQTKNNENIKQNNKQNSKQSNTHSDKQIANKQQTNNKQPIYNVLEEGKEVKKGKEIKEVVSDRNFPVWFDESLKKDLEEYLMIRKQKKYPITDTIIKRIIRKITDYSNENKLFAHDLFENAINGGWQDIYPIKDKNNNIIIPEKPLPDKTPEEIESMRKLEEQIRESNREIMRKAIVSTGNNKIENNSDIINSFAENFGR